MWLAIDMRSPRSHMCMMSTTLFLITGSSYVRNFSLLQSLLQVPDVAGNLGLQMPAIGDADPVGSQEPRQV
jgi:hypothetical protein